LRHLKRATTIKKKIEEEHEVYYKYSNLWLSLKKNASKTKKHRKYDGIHGPGYDLASREFMIGSEILFFFY
jgi:hypothetical protein